MYNLVECTRGSYAMKTYTMETAVANFDELMKDAQEGLTNYIIGSDGREYELILKRMSVNKPRKPGQRSQGSSSKLLTTLTTPLPEFEPYME